MTQPSGNPAAEDTRRLPLPDSGMVFTRADLVFFGVDHSGPSYQVRLELIGLAEDGGEVGRERASYAVFGHGGCFGDEGHCQVRAPLHAFDRRPPHQLTPATKAIIVTGPVQRLIAQGAATLGVETTAAVRESPYAKPDEPAEIAVCDEMELRLYR
jgi:hypothetical protein